MPATSSAKKLLLIGASRGLGFALAAEYLKRGWYVVATERVRSTSQLKNLLGASDGRLEIENISQRPCSPRRMLLICSVSRRAVSRRVRSWNISLSATCPTPTASSRM